MTVKRTVAAFFLLAMTASSALGASHEECELIKRRIDKYAELLDALAFLDEDFIMSNRDFNDLHKNHVSLEILGGELDRIHDVQSAIERICR
ncbi:hypothetical protein [Agrobacterium tumefaciens]|uniref:hypothetical protein n=1 Tax=Agrobacterium tumefaciens TaxID=358 RepID=UPI003BA2A91B